MALRAVFGGGQAITLAKAAGIAVVYWLSSVLAFAIVLSCAAVV